MWSKYQTSILVSISFCVMLSMFWFMPSVALVIFLSILLAILLNSSVDKLVRRKVPRGLAAGLVLLFFLSMVSYLFFAISKTFIPSLTNFIADIPNMAGSLKSLPIYQFFETFHQEIDALLKNFTTFSMTALKSSLDILIGIFSKILDFIIILFVTFYLLKDGKQIKNYLAELFPHKDKTRIMRLFNNIIAALISYIRGQLAVCLITGISVFTYFTIMDLPYASVFAVLSAIGEFIPVVGPTVASAFGSLLAVTQSLTLGIETAIFYLVLTQINHNIVYPYLIGKSLNLHPVAIMLGILLGGQLLGALGMFLAVPCMVIIKLVLEDVFGNQRAILTK